MEELDPKQEHNVTLTNEEIGYIALGQVLLAQHFQDGGWPGTEEEGIKVASMLSDMIDKFEKVIHG